MKDLYQVIPFSELKDGQPVLALACHVVQWDFETMGQPTYAVIPGEEKVEESQKFDYPFQVIAVLVRRLGGEAVILPDEIFENYTVQTFLDVNGVLHITVVPGGKDE